MTLIAENSTTYVGPTRWSPVRLVCRYEQPTETFTNTATKLTETRCGTDCLTEMVIADVEGDSGDLHGVLNRSAESLESPATSPKR